MLDMLYHFPWTSSIMCRWWSFYGHFSWLLSRCQTHMGKFAFVSVYTTFWSVKESTWWSCVVPEHGSRTMLGGYHGLLHSWSLCSHLARLLSFVGTVQSKHRPPKFLGCHRTMLCCDSRDPKGRLLGWRRTYSSRPLLLWWSVCCTTC